MIKSLEKGDTSSHDKRARNIGSINDHFSPKKKKYSFVIDLTCVDLRFVRQWPDSRSKRPMSNNCARSLRNVLRFFSFGSIVQSNSHFGFVLLCSRQWQALTPQPLSNGNYVFVGLC